MMYLSIHTYDDDNSGVCPGEHVCRANTHNGSVGKFSADDETSNLMCVRRMTASTVQPRFISVPVCFIRGLFHNHLCIMVVSYCSSELFRKDLIVSQKYFFFFEGKKHGLYNK